MRQALLNLTTCKVFNASQRLQVPEDLRVSGPLVEDGVERPRLGPVDGRDPIGPLDFEEGLLSGFSTKQASHPDVDVDVIGRAGGHLELEG